MPSLIDVMQRIAAANGGGYPTKEEIMKDPPTHKPEVVRLVLDWKKEVWWPLRNQNPTNQEKFEALKTLLLRIATEHYNKDISVIYVQDAPSCYYNPELRAIAINKSLSILSSLHELSHALFGPSELKACRWSVHLFKKTFPTAFSRLEWKGHMLVKAQPCSVS